MFHATGTLYSSISFMMTLTCTRLVASNLSQREEVYIWLGSLLPRQALWRLDKQSSFYPAQITHVQLVHIHLFCVIYAFRGFVIISQLLCMLVTCRVMSQIWPSLVLWQPRGDITNQIACQSHTLCECLMQHLSCIMNWLSLSTNAIPIILVFR